MQWAMEGGPSRASARVPGRLYASAPFYDSREEVERAAGFVNDRRPDLPPVRILVRTDTGAAWALATKKETEHAA